MKQTPVAIVGYSLLFREGLKILLRRSRFTVVSTAQSLEEALCDPSIRSPELVIYAVGNGPETSSRILELMSYKTELSGTRIVLLSKYPTAEVLRDAATADVNAVLSMDITGEVLQRSLDLVMLGQQTFPAYPHEPAPRPMAAALIPFTRPLASRPTLDNHGVQSNGASDKSVHDSHSTNPGSTRATALSDRERQILRCLVEGAANKTIARNLQITEATVKVHIKGLLRKIQVNNRTQAAVWGLNNSSLFEDTPLDFVEVDRGFDERRQAAS